MLQIILFSSSTEQGLQFTFCLLYTSDAADERSSVDLGGRRIIKKKKYKELLDIAIITNKIIQHYHTNKTTKKKKTEKKTQR